MKYYGLIMPPVFPAGVFIQDIMQTASSDESEGVNTITVTLTNQQKAHFNVKNGKQGSVLEATAKMEQSAKEYISSELTAQKSALEQAIEDGKGAINNSAAQAGTGLQQKVSEAESNLGALIQAKEQDLQGKVDEGKAYIDTQLSAALQGAQESIETKIDKAMETAESKLLTKINSKFIAYHQKGYIQLPGVPSPLEDTSMHYEGYSWYEVNYDGNFFRAKGRNAKAFSAKKLTKEQIKNGNYIFQDDEQGDVIRDITGGILFNAGEAGRTFSGAFSAAPSGEGYVWAQNSYGEGPLQYLSFKASGVVPTAEENRSRNLTFTFWVLVKNE